jgi:quercetin dioxygenase-like cupin family protein
MPSFTVLPRRIENPVTGDRVEFLTSPLSGEAGPLVFRTTLAPYAKGSPLHRHRGIAETFTVESGPFTFLDPSGKALEMEAGDKVEVAAGVAHGFRNETRHPVVFLTSATPGVGFEKFLRVMFGLAEEGRTDRNGMPRDPRALALALVYAELVLAGGPEAFQATLIKALAALGRSAGIERDLERRFARSPTGLAEAA